MDMDELLADLAFSCAPGIGPQRYSIMRKVFGTSKRAFEAQEQIILDNLPARAAHSFIRFRQTSNPKKLLAEYQEKSIRVINRSHPLYPPSLLQISDPPICLYISSKLTDPELVKVFGSVLVSIVGSRKHSSYGREITNIIAYDLAKNGVTIVSGMALGIDAIAHMATLDAGGKTIAILGCGVDVIYPQENEHLYKRISDSGSVILSEFAPGTQPIPGYFVARNRLVAGISRAVVIVEGTAKSGSLITARIAADQGKDVYAVPGQVSSPLSEAPLLLIKQGARMVTEAGDILGDIGMSAVQGISKTPTFSDPLEQKIYEYVQIHRDIYPDELAHALEVSISQITTLISRMEIRGLLTRTMTGALSL